MKDSIDLIARVFLAFIFFFEAYDSIRHFKATKEAMTSYGITWNQDILLSCCLFLLILGGILVLIGYRSKLGAIMLLIYFIPVTFILHSWWNDPGDIKRIQSILFMKNLAIMGGLLMVVVNGSGKYSVKRLFATTKVP